MPPRRSRRQSFDVDWTMGQPRILHDLSRDELRKHFSDRLLLVLVSVSRLIKADQSSSWHHSIDGHLVMLFMKHELLVTPFSVLCFTTLAHLFGNQTNIDCYRLFPLKSLFWNLPNFNLSLFIFAKTICIHYFGINFLEVKSSLY